MDLTKADKPYYSQLLKDIEAGKIQSLILIPARREVQVEYSNGSTYTLPILHNDQQILRSAEASRTPLTVKDIRQEQALAMFTVNFSIGIIFIVGLSLLLSLIHI